MQPKKAWVDVALLAGACALLAFGLTAYFQVGALHSLSHASYFAFGAWAGTALLVGGEIIWRVVACRASKTEKSKNHASVKNPTNKVKKIDPLTAKNQRLRKEILRISNNPPPFIPEGAEDYNHVHCIFEGVYLGNITSYACLNPDYEIPFGKDFRNKKDIKYVISVTTDTDEDALAVNCKKLGIRRLQIEAGKDGPEYWPIMRSRFDAAFEMIDRARANNESVLIHCEAGSSRSAALVFAYLMRTCQVTLMQAYEYVRATRNIVVFEKFQSQLEDYQAELGIEG